jgi:hypothetical protein
MVEWQRLRIAVAGAALFCAHDAAAQSKPEPQPGSPATVQLSSAGDVAEQRFHAGDCAGALDAFDAALRNGRDPTLRRDRGVCHDKLGHPFPAIEDYRFYVMKRPDAADADSIRARIAELEEQAGVIKPGQAGVSGKSGAQVSTSIGGETDLSASSGGKGGLAALENKEQLDTQAANSAVRRGHGLILGLAAGGRYFTNSKFGGAEIAGLDLRYSFSSSSTALLEVSIGHVTGASSKASLSGPGILGGYELRIPFDARVSDALLLGVTFRYESLSESNGYVFAVLEPEGRVGYRHVFGPSLGVEAVVDGGAAVASITGLANSGTTQGLIGGHLAVVLGF